MTKPNEMLEAVIDAAVRDNQEDFEVFSQALEDQPQGSGEWKLSFGTTNTVSAYDITVHCSDCGATYRARGISFMSDEELERYGGQEGFELLHHYIECPSIRHTYSRYAWWYRRGFGQWWASR